MKYTAFDLEITKEIPKGTDDWKSLRPLGISCAATFTSDGELKLWHGERLPSGLFSRSMLPHDVIPLIDYLAEQQEAGYTIVTWNGLGFDFDVLAEESQSPLATHQCRELALAHIDMAFAMLCEKGYMCGLNNAAKGMGLSGKTEGMSGALAPTLWAQGREEQEKVLEYVGQDARTTAQVYEAIIEKGGLTWVTRKGYLTKSPWCPATGRILTVREANETPLPNTSWMDNPWPREKFLGWTETKGR